jgi:two-component system, LytTR family, sensor kinase
MKKVVVVFLHLGYWVLYLFVMLLLLAMMNMNKPPTLPTKIIEALFFSAFGMGALIPALLGFYVFYADLFKRYLTSKRLLNLVFASICVSLGASIITQLLMYLILPAHKNVNWSVNTCVFAGLFLTCIAFINGVLGMVLKGFITWYSDIKLKVELTKKNYEMELALMKAQIQPHFLFNTLNNIDTLIQKDPIKASNYLNKLSDIMRFMLYETKTEKILLSKELSYIEKYIELQKIRTTNSNYVKYEVIGEAASILIEPMLFIPFIENAFKHSENKKIENAICVYFAIEKDKIRFECENAYVLETQLKHEHGGLGNSLIQKRLALLYPNKHTYEIVDKNGIYKVILLLSTKYEN